MTSRKRERLVPDEASTSAKNRVIEPTRQMPLMTLRPSRAMGRAISTIGGPLREADVDVVRTRGIVERHGTFGFPVDELLHERRRGLADLVGGAFAHDLPVGYEIK